MAESRTKMQEHWYERGQEDFSRGKKAVDNPYLDGAGAYKYWNAGWMDAMHKACVHAFLDIPHPRDLTPPTKGRKIDLG